MSSRHTFRARNLDPGRSLEVYGRDELHKKTDFVQGDRAMPTMASGMEAEEETEHHLQRAIATETLSGGKKFIPTPEPTKVEYYHDIYSDVRYLTRKWKQGYVIQELKILEDNPPQYNLDDEDEQFCKTFENPKLDKKELENMIDQLEECEQGQGPLPPFCKEWSWGRGIIGEYSDHAEVVHQFWVKKRSRTSGPLQLRLLREKPVVEQDSESYLCFRKRLDRIQTRRNKQRDQISYTRMVKLRRDLMTLLNMCALMKDRERKKAQLVDKEHDLINARIACGDWENKTISEYIRSQEPEIVPGKVNGFSSSGKPNLDSNSPNNLCAGIANSITKSELPSKGARDKYTEKYKSKKKKPGGDSSKVPEVCDPAFSSKFSFKHENAKPGAFYLEEKDVKIMDNKDGEPQEGYRILSTHHQTLGYCRRRIGRGGRILTDRAFHPNHEIITQMSLPASDPELASIPIEAVDTPSASTMRALIDDIKKQRVRHFSPGEPRKRKRMNPTKKR